MSGSTKFASWDANTDGRSSGKTYFFAPRTSHCTGRIVDILSLKRHVPTFTLDSFIRLPEVDDVVVEPPKEYLNRLCSGWHVHKHLVETAKAIAGSSPGWSAMG